jgi:hypothetical protein
MRNYPVEYPDVKKMRFVKIGKPGGKGERKKLESSFGLGVFFCIAWRMALAREL